MQRGGFSRTCRTAHEKQAIRLADRTLDQLVIARREAHFFQRQRFARGKNTHHHIFHPPLRRDGCHAQLDVQRPEFFEFDLAILRLALFRYIQIAHDLETRYQRVAVSGRHLDVVEQRAILAQPYLRLSLAGLRLDVNIRRTHPIGIHDDLVDQLDQFVIGRRIDIILCNSRNFVIIPPHAGQQVIHG